MKIHFKLLLLILLFSCKSNCSVIDSINTCKQEQIVVTRLKMIESYQSDTTTVKYGERINCIFFLELLTEKYCATCGDFFGYFEPTIDDYNNWNGWYQTRKDSICNDYYKHRIDSIYKLVY